MIDFGTLLVGSEVQRVLLLVNGSECSMYYKMESSMPHNVTYKDGEGAQPPSQQTEPYTLNPKP